MNVGVGLTVRNILEYPVTKQEVLDALKKAELTFLREELIGDIRPYALSLAFEWIEKHGPAHFHG